MLFGMKIQNPDNNPSLFGGREQGNDSQELRYSHIHPPSASLIQHREHLQNKPHFCQGSHTPEAYASAQQSIKYPL